MATFYVHLAEEEMGEVCCVCRQRFQKGKQKVECCTCQAFAHRTCLPSVSNEIFPDFKLSWTCSRCENGTSKKTKPTTRNGKDAAATSSNVPCNSECHGDFYDILQRISSLAITERKQFAHLNINGVKGKFPEICELLAKNRDILVLALTESRLGEEDRDYVIPSFQVKKIDRRNGENGGGQLIYVHSSCSFEMIRLPWTPPGLVECNILSISSKTGMPRTNLCVIYVPPRDARNSFIDFFSNVCKLLTCSGRRVVIIGDFNVNWLVDSSYKRRLEEILVEFELAQVIDEPTRGETLIDHIYVKRKDSGGAVARVHANASSSDHDMISVKFI